MPKISLNQNEIAYVETAKNLGVTFNNNLTWNNHILSTIAKVYGMIRVLRVTQQFTPVKIRLLLAKTYLIPKLLYGCEIFSNCSEEYKRKLNVTYNEIARYVFNKNRFQHISSFSAQIFNLKFDHFLNFRTLCLLQKIVFKKEPSNLFHHLQFSKSNRNNQLITKKFTKSSSENHFFIYAIRLWNSLPTNLQSISNHVQFKNNLKKYLSDLWLWSICLLCCSLFLLNVVHCFFYCLLLVQSLIFSFSNFC